MFIKAKIKRLNTFSFLSGVFAAILPARMSVSYSFIEFLPDYHVDGGNSASLSCLRNPPAKYQTINTFQTQNCQYLWKHDYDVLIGNIQLSLKDAHLSTPSAAVLQVWSKLLSEAGHAPLIISHSVVLHVVDVCAQNSFQIPFCLCDACIDISNLLWIQISYEVLLYNWWNRAEMHEMCRHSLLNSVTATWKMCCERLRVCRGGGMDKKRSDGFSRHSFDSASLLTLK